MGKTVEAQPIVGVFWDSRLDRLVFERSPSEQPVIIDPLAVSANTHIANATDAHDASAVSVLDAGGLLAATDVEAALAELAAGAVKFANGLVGTPSITFTSDPDTGIYRGGADDIRIAAGGADVLRMTTAAFIINAPALSVGTTPSTAGTIRLPNAGTIQGRNAANSGDIGALTITNADVVVVGFSTVAGVRMGQTGGSIGFYGTTPIGLQTGVAVTAGGIHAALVNLGLISA